MVAKVFTSGLHGIDGIKVEVEVDISHGLPSFSIVGLPEPSVKESRERVRAAIKNAGFEFPNDRITINLAPADVRKEGSSFDLPVALGLLAAMGVITQGAIENHLVTGELSLDGRIKGTRGVLPMAVLAAKGTLRLHDRPGGERARGRGSKGHKGLWRLPPARYRPLPSG